MNVGQAIAAALKQEGVEYLFCYPTNRIIEEAALAGIRPIVVRQERTGVHMADAMARMSGGRQPGVFAMQHGPGAENSYGAVAQAYAESVPVLVIAQGYPQKSAGVGPNFSSARSMRDVAKGVELLRTPDQVNDLMRRAFSLLRNGRGGPVVVEVPRDLWSAEVRDEAGYRPIRASRSRPAASDVAAAVELIAGARRPVIYAGQGIHYAGAWSELRQLAETVVAPVATTLPGKSAFPEDHSLSLGSGGLSWPLAVRRYLHEADLVLALGTSLTESAFAVPFPRGKRVVQLTVDAGHLNKDVPVDVGLIGHALDGIRDLLSALASANYRCGRDMQSVASEIAMLRTGWLDEWRGLLDSNDIPISPYRVVSELMKETQSEDVVVTHDAGRPRDQLTPFWQARDPLSFIGWGKTTQLGYGLPLAMGAKLSFPGKLCINIWGDAAIGFTGTDLETAARERIPILSILLNNGGMATELKTLANAAARYDAIRITGNYAAMAEALGCYSERITDPGDVGAAIARGIRRVREGRTVLLEFITSQETRFPQP